MVIFGGGGWCANCQNQRKTVGGGVRIVRTKEKQHTHEPQFCICDVRRQFCGGDAWILRSDPNLVRFFDFLHLIHRAPFMFGPLEVLLGKNILRVSLELGDPHKIGWRRNLTHIGGAPNNS